LGDINPLSTALEPDGSTVSCLMGVTLTGGDSYQMKVSDVTDLAGHTLTPNPTLLTFTAGGDVPRLTITLSGTDAVISWPAPSTGFNLEQTSQLATPGSIAWTPVNITPMVINGRNTVNVTATTGNSFFRLRR